MIITQRMIIMWRVNKGDMCSSRLVVVEIIGQRLSSATFATYSHYSGRSKHFKPREDIERFDDNRTHAKTRKVCGFGL